MRQYRVIYTGQGAGYAKDDIINIPDEISTVKGIVWEVSRKANLAYADLGYLQGNEKLITFGTRIDGITFKTPVLIIQKI